MTTGDPDAERFDVLIVGAGFAGLHLLHQARAAGLRAKVLEKAGGVGGTWFWNRYPGARCDIESFDYQFSFAPELVAEWRWSERYAAQPEILRYLEFAATRLDLYRDIDFGVTVRSATFDETTAIWTLATSTGERLLANYCVMAVGNLSAIKRPDVAGLEDFGGQWFHTGNWPTQPVDLTDKRVAVIGTGSSGSQTITAIAPVVAQLYVLQRTPNYSMPAQNRPITDAENAEVLADWELRRHTCEWSDAGTPLPPATRRAIDVTDADRAQAYAEGWQRGGISALSGAFTDMFTDERSNQFAQNFAREQIRATVADPAVADLLCPSHHIGTKRTCVDTGYFQTFNRPNVELVDVRQAPIVEVNESGIRTADRQIDVDVIIFAIGFDAITGAVVRRWPSRPARVNRILWVHSVTNWISPHDGAGRRHCQVVERRATSNTSITWSPVSRPVLRLKMPGMSIRSRISTSSGIFLMVTSGIRVPVSNTRAAFTNGSQPSSFVRILRTRSASKVEFRK